MEHRVKIMEIARQAYDKAGMERNEAALSHAVRYGKLALGGAKEEALADEAEEVPSTEHLIQLLRGAGNMWEDWGQEKRPAACNKLADFYLQR